METLIKKLNHIQNELKVPKEYSAGNQNKVMYKYRSVEDIYEKAKPLLKEAGLLLSIKDEMVMIGTRIYVKAIATISDGKNSIEAVAYSREPERANMSEPQLTGSCSSYARKYALGGLLLLDDSKDIDSIENHTSAKGNANKDLNAIKQEVASVLGKAGLKRADFTRFFEFANIDKDNADELKAFLLRDYKILISDFILGGKNV